jgi:hypothetical protein
MILMGKVVTNASMSLDGFIAKDDNTIGHLFDWLQDGDVEIDTVTPGITFHIALGDPTTCIRSDRVVHLVYPVQR